MSKRRKSPNTSSGRQAWQSSVFATQSERLDKFSTVSDLPSLPLASAEDLLHWKESEKLGFPGEFPYTRGIQPTMYRGRLWTMRQFAGFGTPEDTNRRFHYLLEHGQNGLSTAFDMPTLMGYDADHPQARGEVGREGVSVSTIDDMDRLFANIDLTSVTTSMTINCTAAPILAMYFAVARRRGQSLQNLGGTIQNDILKEFIAQKEWISPPAPSLRLSCDIIEFCSQQATKFNPISISGYHIREAGATAVQELAFTLYDGITYVEECLRRGLAIDTFAPRLSFFFDVHNDFFEEIAKFRAGRRMWAHLMRDRFMATLPASLKLRTHAQTAGVSLTAQEPLNNVARVALQALAAVLGGTQSLHTNSLDETLALPSEEAVKVALRTQQIIAEETGVANTIDPLGGSYFVEELTDRIEHQAYEYIRKLDELGGMLRALEVGFPQKEIADSAYHFQRQLENQEKVIVGVNKYQEGQVKPQIPLMRVSLEVEKNQRDRVLAFKAARSDHLVQECLQSLRDCCRNKQNIMPKLMEAVDAGVTVGEVSDVYRECFGIYSDPGLL